MFTMLIGGLAQAGEERGSGSKINVYYIFDDPGSPERLGSVLVETIPVDETTVAAVFERVFNEWIFDVSGENYSTYYSNEPLLNGIYFSSGVLTVDYSDRGRNYLDMGSTGSFMVKNKILQTVFSCGLVHTLDERVNGHNGDNCISDTDDYHCEASANHYSFLSTYRTGGFDTFLNEYFALETMIPGSIPSGSTPENGINVQVNGVTLSFDQPPIVENGRVLVPLRAIFEALGAKVEWVDSYRKVIAIKDGIVITMQINDNTLRRNGVNIPSDVVQLDVPAMLVGGRTLVPVRAVAESFGAEVGWDQDTQSVIITTAANINSPTTISNPVLYSEKTQRSNALNGKRSAYEGITVATGVLRSAAITADGDLYAWGAEGYGASYTGDTPTKVPGLSDVVAVSFGRNHYTAITADGSLYT